MKKTLLSVLTIVFIAACQPGAINDRSPNMGGDVEWSCVQYQCADFGSGLEWADANCQQTQNGTYCPITQNGQQYLIPLDQMNLTAITESRSFCKQYRCVQEAPSRATNYTVDRTELTGQQAGQGPGPQQAQQQQAQN